MTDYSVDTQFAQAIEIEATYGLQTAFGGSEVWFLGTRPDVTFGDNSEEMDLGFATDQIAPNRVHNSTYGGTFSGSCLVEGQSADYVAPADVLQTTAAMMFLAAHFGNTHSGTNVAADVAAASTAVLWKLTAAAPDEGACYYVGDVGAQTVEAVGWAVDLAAGPDLTVFEDAIAIPTVGNDLYGMKTYASDSSHQATTSFSWRIKHWSDDHDLYLRGCCLRTLKIRGHAGKDLILEYSGVFASHYLDTGSGDGMPRPTEDAINPAAGTAPFRRLSTILHDSSSRLTIDGGSTGVAAPTGTCGMANFEIELESVLKPLDCHSGYEGVGSMLTLKRMFTLTHTYPWLASDISSGRSTWEASYEDRTGHSVMLQVGGTVGKVLSMLMPNGIIVERPQLTSVDGMMSWQLKWQPEYYAGDTGATFPANSSGRIAMG